MGTPIGVEVYVFFGTILLGAVWGLLFDLFRVFRRVARPGVFAVSVSDVLFWILSWVLTSGAILYLNDGQLRWYVFLGIVLGGIFYFLLLSRLILTGMVKILGFLLKILHFILKILLTPLCFLYKILIVPICGCFTGITAGLRNRIKRLLKRGIPHEKRAYKKRQKNNRGRVRTGRAFHAGKRHRTAARDYQK